MQDDSAGGLRLFKANLSACFPTDNGDDDNGVYIWESHATETIVSAMLLEMIEREGARRFIIHSGKKDGLLVCQIVLPYCRLLHSHANCS